ncbi:MAG: DUF2764 family protein [Treponema sp.]|nr:DUF2764 family protein [Treponema sp.]
MAYYYLISQLPALIYGQTVPLTSKSFVELCKTNLSPKDFQALNVCVLNPPPSSIQFIEQWHTWERSLRLNIARYRASKIKREGPLEAPEYPASAVNTAKTAVTIESPLEAELFLDEARWRTIEELQGITYFSINTVYAYLLKLLLMERRACFIQEEGFEEYKKLYTVILARGTTEGSQ